MQWRYREKRNYQEHHQNVSFFIQLNFEFFVFCFWEIFLFNSYVPCYVTWSCRKTFKRCSDMFSKTGVLKNFAIFTGKNLCWSLFLIEFQDWRPTFLFKKRLQRRCFSVNIAKFLRTVVLLKNCSLYLFEIFIWW